jgi:hypothetical protein
MNIYEVILEEGKHFYYFRYNTFEDATSHFLACSLAGEAIPQAILDITENILYVADSTDLTFITRDKFIKEILHKVKIKELQLQNPDVSRTQKKDVIQLFAREKKKIV